MLTQTIASYLDGLGYGTFADSGYDENNNIFINTQPQKPDIAISIFDTGGEGKDIGFPDIRRSVQILVRHNSVINGNYLCWAIYNAMTTTATNGFLFIDGRKMLVRSIDTPSSIGKDENGLFEWSVNFSIWTQDDIY
jgi:hypothetical protein